MGLLFSMNAQFPNQTQAVSQTSHFQARGKENLYLAQRKEAFPRSKIFL